MTKDASPARTLDEVKKLGCFKCGGQHFKTDRATGKVCQRTRQSEEKRAATPPHHPQEPKFAPNSPDRPLIAQQLSFAESPARPVQQSMAFIDNLMQQL